MLNPTELKTISSLIAKASKADLDTIWKNIKCRDTVLLRNSRKAFKIGDSVKFTDRTGKEVVGTIQKINTKTIIVFSDNVRWKVTPSLLSPAQPKTRKAA